MKEFDVIIVYAAVKRELKQIADVLEVDVPRGSGAERIAESYLRQKTLCPTWMHKPSPVSWTGACAELETVINEGAMCQFRTTAYNPKDVCYVYFQTAA